MKAGKPSESVLSRSVLKQLNKDSGAPISRMKQLDYGCNKTEEGILLAATETISFPCPKAAELAVTAAANNLACSGHQASAVTLSILFPTTGAEQDLRALVKEAEEACTRLGARLTGGHTEILSGIQAPILTATAMATAKDFSDLILSNGAKPNMDLIVTKHIGLSGCAMLAQREAVSLKERYSQPFLDRAEAFWAELSVAEEAAIAKEHGAGALHDLSNGGIYGALWELLDRSNVGALIDLKAIPIKQETVEICEHLNVNPYKLYGAGSLLIATEHGDALVEKLAAAKIPSAVIGRTTDGKDRILYTGEEERFLETTQPDELFR